MLPAIFVTVAMLLFAPSLSSPVYNMQPAFITANIGTVGRNIRNLPCISRKTNQRGVCMFAIDCLKANGTHLGTCIDRFYFGSCCHVEPVHDITDNTIESDIIPAREPPLRLSSTIKPITTTTSKTDIKTTNATTTTTTTILPVTNKTTTLSYKLTTFQSVEASTTPETTTPITKTTTTRTTLKPKPSKTTAKPTKPTKTVTKVPTDVTTTRKPSTSTRKPSTSTVTTTKPTRKPSASTRRPSTSTATTRKPSTTTSTTTQPSTITTKKTVTTTTSSTTTTTKPTTTVLYTTTPKPTTPEIKNITQPPPTTIVNKIPSTTSVKPPSTTSSSIVTWTIATEKNATTITTSTPNLGNSTSEEFVPITTPDTWVPLPSVRPSLATESASLPSITYIPLESSTSSVTLNATTAGVTSPSSPVTPPPSSVSSSATPETEIRPVNMSDFTDVCGRRMYPEARIVGGEKSYFGKWPWQISLRQWRTSTYLHKCGAALLNENWAITAAHCVDNVAPSDLLLRLGEHDLSTESEPYLHQERRVQIVASHPNFDARTFEYDLALLRFYEPVTFQPNILPVCVPQTDENFVGRTAYVTGWGRLYEDGPLPSILQEVSVPVINNSVCESMYRSAGYIEHIPNIFICAGWRRGGFDSCEGDSGGPMVIQREDKRFLLAGVISWGIGCAEPNQPGVYTRISEFRDWINQILQF